MDPNNVLSIKLADTNINLGKFEYISNVDSATYVVWGETFCTPGWSIGSVNKRGAGYLRQKLFGGNILYSRLEK